MTSELFLDALPVRRTLTVSPSVRSKIPIRQMWGIPVHAATMSEVLEICRETIEANRRLMIGVINAAKVVAMRRDPVLNASVMGSDMVLADGMSVVMAGRILGQRLPERIPGIDLFENLLKLADEHGYSVYFLGAAQDVLDEVVRRARRKHPNLKIAGSHNGYFTPEASGKIAAKIRASQADMLFVAMTSPKKENFLARWGKYMNVRICHGVGGSFDVMAGKVKRAPLAWQKIGLEWLYRVIQEPRRMWKRYLVTNTLFMLMLGREFLWTRFYSILRLGRSPEHTALTDTKGK